MCCWIETWVKFSKVECDVHTISEWCSKDTLIYKSRNLSRLETISFRVTRITNLAFRVNVAQNCSSNYSEWYMSISCSSNSRFEKLEPTRFPSETQKWTCREQMEKILWYNLNGCFMFPAAKWELTSVPWAAIVKVREKMHFPNHLNSKCGCDIGHLRIKYAHDDRKRVQGMDLPCCLRY